MAEITLTVPNGTKSWKTTLAGAITALGAYLVTLEGWEKMAGQVLMVVGPILFGLFSKDANVTGGTVPQPSSPAAIAVKAEEAATSNISGVK